MRSFSIASTLGILALAVTASAAPAKKEAWASGHIGSVDTVGALGRRQAGQARDDVRGRPRRHPDAGRDHHPTDRPGRDTGKPVKVRYTMNGTTKTADRVEVGAATAGPAKAPARPRR